jgi:probable rRNA maturation factor
MQIKIEFCEEIKLVPAIKESLTKLVIDALKIEGVENEYEVNIHFVDSSRIQELNNQYLGIDAVTDVLSFPLLSQEDLVKKFNYPVLLGDIFICIPQAISQAALYGHSQDREIGFLCVHGILHLLGYDHIDSDETKVMFMKQEALLEKNGLKRDANA